MTRSDYEQAVENLRKIYQLDKDSDRYRSIYDGNIGIWNFLCGATDKDSDGKIDRIEFIEGYKGLLADRENFLALQVGFVKAIIAISDQSGDGNITELEYKNNLRAFNVTEGLDEGFVKMDRHGKGFLTEDVIVENLEEFFYSDDQEAPGNWFVGPW